MLGIAIDIASSIFRSKYDKGGRPYILHCLWVMDKVRHLGDNYMIAAVLHDVIEDSQYWDLERMKAAGFNQEVLDALELLTHDKETPYQEYIQRLAINKIAREVKLRDLEHNSKITRLKGVTDKDIERMEKYHRAYTFLKNYDSIESVLKY